MASLLLLLLPALPLAPSRLARTLLAIEQPNEPCALKRGAQQS